MRVLLVCFVLLATSTSFSSAFVPASRLGFKPEFLPAGSRSPPRGKETVNFFTRQKLDHFAPEDPRVFSQKYLELLDFFRPRNGPIFLVMCGESTCTGNYVTTYVGTLAESFGAAIVTVEHRYYGHSSPFQHLNLHNLKYLTSKQSLFDHAVFIDYYQARGSYAGALSAWFRLKFPHLVAGSWASSAVVEAILDYSAYDKQLGVSVGPKCKQALQEITRLTEQGLVENATEIKYLFGFSPQDNITDDTLLDYVANAAAGEIQYGKIDGLCDPLLKAEKSNRNLLKTYAKILERINNDTNGNERDNESWDFQYCTEVGYFQVASDRKSSVRSSRINTQFFINYCSEQFGNGTFPDVKTTNLYYGGRNIAGSRIMFLNGSQDPWRHASKQTSSKDTNTTKCRELARAHAFIHSNFPTIAMSTPKYVVGLDFGTTFSGFAFAHRSNPSDIHSFYEWPSQREVGAKPYCKTQTSLLYSTSWPSPSSAPSLELQHWGHDAERHNSGSIFVTKFKLHLAPAQPSSSPPLPPWFLLHRGLSVEKVTVDYLRCISSFAKLQLKELYKNFFREEEVQWCLTVPALWDDAAKQNMRTFAEAAGISSADFPVKIILEPEAASFYCQTKLIDSLKFKRNDTFLVADVGGGTIDTVVHTRAFQNGVKVRETSACSGAIGGATFVDENMMSFLAEKIGCLPEFVKLAKNRMQLMKWWFQVKCSFDGSPDFVSTWTIPGKLSKAWRKHDEKLGVERDYGEYDELKFNATDIKAVFDPEVDKIVHLISQQLDGSSDKVRYIFLVGGFANNPYLVTRVREAFKERVAKVFVPPNPGSAICNGAVMLGFDDRLVLSRISRRTYGMSSIRPFEVGDPLQYMLVDEDGHLCCENNFLVSVRKNQPVPQDSKVETIVSPVGSKQEKVRLELYTSIKDHPRFVTEVGSTLEESFGIDVSSGVELGRGRAVLVSMFFGRSMIEVTARRLNFGNREEERVYSVEFSP
ncbi:hypothetical protein SELMODRAFT_416857 [Selaginella moellendorffii]|uniref:Uncharacterized protein n=2 Tax=Selaginella moellendorffii TaxID=88036 RepID=D8S0M0_SELML|nr:hypothetical protein SELMODRAFT_416857 [Selaginella moellendorffii]